MKYMEQRIKRMTDRYMSVGTIMRMLFSILFICSIIFLGTLTCPKVIEWSRDTEYQETR